jgi:hypothetical protein
MRKPCILSIVGILGLSLLLTGIFPGLAFTKGPGWIQDHIMDVQDMEMYDPFFVLFGQREEGVIVDYTYEEVVKLVGHSCGATASGWEITKKALEVLYPDGEIPVRGNIKVYAPGAEDEWNIGVIGEVITYLTGAAPATGFSGAEFGNGLGPYPGDPVYKRRNKMVYTDDCVGTWPPNKMVWTFERLDTNAKACIRFKYVDTPYGEMGIQEPVTPAKKMLGARIASGDTTLTEGQIDGYISWWNQRNEYVFMNTELLVVDVTDECSDPPCECPSWPPAQVRPSPSCPTPPPE